MVGSLPVCWNWSARGACSRSSNNALRVLDADSSSAHLISLRIPAPIGLQAQHPAPIGREMAPQVARAQLPVAATQPSQHLISSRI